MEIDTHRHSSQLIGLLDKSLWNITLKPILNAIETKHRLIFFLVTFRGQKDRE